MTEQQAIKQVLSRFELVREAVSIEPRILDVFRYALSGPYQSDNRWIEYEHAKYALRRLVGWGADHPALQTTAHYEVCVRAIDYLLPESLYAEDIEAAAGSGLLT